MKRFNGKVIYNPSGKAGEYSYWACNFYAGCSNGCDYCYLTKGRSAKTYEHRYPKLKAHFKDEVEAMKYFQTETSKNLDELRAHGLFFTFTSDPLLPETIKLTCDAVIWCNALGIPVKLLTKTGLLAQEHFRASVEGALIDRKLVAYGVTLTGHDEREPFAKSNLERIETLRFAKGFGYRTFASIEPVIDIDSSKEMIYQSCGYCDLYKIGLESGKRFNRKELVAFIEWVTLNLGANGNAKIYFKDSLLNQAGIDRGTLLSNCVTRDYNIFKDEHNI